VAQQGDSVATAINHTVNSPYRIIHQVQVPGAPAVQIYRRDIETSLTPR
jgi:hypothetical protein